AEGLDIRGFAYARLVGTPRGARFPSPPIDREQRIRLLPAGEIRVYPAIFQGTQLVPRPGGFTAPWGAAAWQSNRWRSCWSKTTHRTRRSLSARSGEPIFPTSRSP